MRKYTWEMIRMFPDPEPDDKSTSPANRQHRDLFRFFDRMTGKAECDLKAAENDCLERRNSIRPRVSSRVAYKAERGGNELFWSPWRMYPRSQERHRNREATVYLPA